jgi:hypothetical protein
VIVRTAVAHCDHARCYAKKTLDPDGTQPWRTLLAAGWAIASAPGVGIKTYCTFHKEDATS